MSAKKYKYTHGKPVLTSVWFFAYSLLWVFTFARAAYDAYNNPIKGCSYSWISEMALYVAWIVSTVVFFIHGSIVLYRYKKRINFLKASKQVVPKSYKLVLISLALAASQVIWVPMINTKHRAVQADTTMNTLDEFRTLAQDCRVYGAAVFENGLEHQATDADSYIIISDTTFGGAPFYYSTAQKGELISIYDEYADQCAQKYTQYSYTLYKNQISSQSTWSKDDFASAINNVPQSHFCG